MGWRWEDSLDPPRTAVLMAWPSFARASTRWIRSPVPTKARERSTLRLREKKEKECQLEVYSYRNAKGKGGSRILRRVRRSSRREGRGTRAQPSFLLETPALPARKPRLDTEMTKRWTHEPYILHLSGSLRHLSHVNLSSRRTLLPSTPPFSQCVRPASSSS